MKGGMFRQTFVERLGLRGPKMTAFHIMMLSALGEPLIPIGGSVESRLKSRIRRRFAAVDYKISSAHIRR
jgi:hypothetical protein